MLLTITVLRLGLSVVFGVAGVAKVLDQSGTRAAVTNFGAPVSWSKPLALLLPLAEIVVALGLLVSTTAWGSAVAAILLLGLFITAIGINLIRGRAPECHCFGQLYSRPLGWPTLLRNIAFGVCAGYVVWQGRQATRASSRALSEKLAGEEYFALSALGATAIVIATIIYFQRARAKTSKDTNAHNYPAPDLRGLPVGAVAPAFRLRAYRGDQTDLGQLLESRRPLLLIFSNPNCGPCAALFAELAQWQRVYPERVTIAVLTQGTIKDNFVNIARNDLRNILFQNQREVAELYQCLATPSGVLVSPDGRIASAPAAGADKIRILIHSTLEEQDQSDTTTQAQIRSNTNLPQAATENDEGREPVEQTAASGTRESSLTSIQQ